MFYSSFLQMVYICPKKFPLSVAMALAAISVDTAHEKDRLSRACLATLCELGIYVLCLYVSFEEF